MKFTTVRSKEKDDVIYLKSEKLVMTVISNLTNSVAAIWREKIVDPCYLETKK